MINIELNGDAAIFYLYSYKWIGIELLIRSFKVEIQSQWPADLIWSDIINRFNSTLKHNLAVIE